jgi:sugar lactone lactonase YvrE
MRKFLVKSFVVLLLVVAAFLLVLKMRYGGPVDDFPNMSTKPLLPDTLLQVVATLDEAPGNIAVSESGRVFFNFHPEGQPALKVVEWVNGKAVPFPDDAFQHERGKGEPFFDGVFSVRIDRQNRLWTLDPGFHGVRQPRLLAFDITTRALVHQWDIPSRIAGIGSYAQDFQVSPDGRYVYIADIGVINKKPCIIVYDAQTGKAWRRLENHPSVKNKDYVIKAPGKEMKLLGGLFVMNPAIDPIGLDKQGEWLYYAAMSTDRMYRIKATDLRDTTLNDEALGKRVEDYGPKSQCDGISLDSAGNIYITSIEHGAIDILSPDRKLQTLLQSKCIRWADGLSFGPDGYLYITDSDIPDVMLQSKAHMNASKPYYIYRFKTGQVSVPGQ